MTPADFRLTDLAQSEIDSLVADGVYLSPQDILRIQRLSLAIETPETRRQLAMGQPVECGRYKLYPLTLAGAAWYSEMSPALPKESDQIAALAFAMCYGRSICALADLGRRGLDSVRQWSSTLGITPKELVNAIAEVLAQDDDIAVNDPNAKQNGMTAGGLSAFLVASAGGSPEVWERQCSIGYVLSVLQAIAAQNQHDGKPSMSDPRIQAERKLGLYVEGLRKRNRSQS